MPKGTGFRRRYIIMYETRQHIPSFVGVYVPPCGDVLSSIDIRICNITAVIAMEVFAVTLTDMVADITGLRGVSRVYSDKPDTRTPALVLKERAELGERPGVDSASKALVSAFPIDAKTDIGKVFNGDTLMLRLSLFDKLLADGMVGNGNKPAFTPFEPFQQPMTVACAFSLNGRSRSIVSVSHPLDFGRGRELVVGSGNDVRDTHVHTDKLINRFLFLFRDVYGLKKEKLALTENQVCLTFGKRHKFGAMAGVGNPLTTSKERDGYLTVGCVRKNPAIIGYRAKFPKPAHLLPIKLVSICNLAYRSYDKLRRKVVGFLDRVISFLMEVELLKRVTLPGNLRNNVTRLIEHTHRLFECISLFLCGKQLYLKGKFHTVNIVNYPDSQLFETGILSTKEGMMPTFLPETEDFWVSLGQIL